MIPYATIKSAILSELDAEGSDYYNDQLDIVPALNSAQDDLLQKIGVVIGSKKFSEESLRGIIQTRIYQPSIYSRINVDQIIASWGIISVMVNPVVAIPPALSTTWVPLPVPNPDQSTMASNFIYVSGGKGCRRLNSQEWVANTGNPMLDGYIPTAAEVAYAAANNITLNTGYSYLSHIDNLSTIDPAMPYEITIRPTINSSTPVAITTIKYPTRVTYPALNNVDFSPVFLRALVKSTLQQISIKQGDRTTLWSVSQQEVNEIMGAIS